MAPPKGQLSPHACSFRLAGEVKPGGPILAETCRHHIEIVIVNRPAEADRGCGTAKAVLGSIECVPPKPSGRTKFAEHGIDALAFVGFDLKRADRIEHVHGAKEMSRSPADPLAPHGKRRGVAAERNVSAVEGSIPIGVRLVYETMQQIKPGGVLPIAHRGEIGKTDEIAFV